MMFYRAKFFLYSDSISSQFYLDIASFGLDPQYKLSDERYMTFYNQPKTPCQAGSV
jgi:stress response protein SCP2